MALSDVQRRRLEGMAERRGSVAPTTAGAKGRAGDAHTALARQCRDAGGPAVQARRALVAAVLKDCPDHGAALNALNALAARHGLPEFDLFDLIAAADAQGERPA